MNLSLKAFKNVVFPLLAFLVSLIFLFGLFFNDFKEKSFINAKKDYELNVERYTTKLEDRILLFDKVGIEQNIKEAKNTNFIKDVKIKYKKYLFNKESLIFQNRIFNDSSWNLADITTDVKFGEIKKIEGTSFFEFIPSNIFDLKENLIIKYQLFNNNEIKNFIVPFDLNLFDDRFEVSENISENSLLESDFQRHIIKELKIDNLDYATVEYFLDDSKLKEEINNYFNWLLILGIIVFIILSVVIIVYNKYLQNRYVLEPIKQLDRMVSDVLEHKFSNVNNNLFEDSSEFKNLLTNISKLSNKIASLVNELNINKESLERNLLTDNLTGLYDKKMFDIDMKSMFVSSLDGYVFLLKIGKLNQIENINGTLKTDDFIVSCVNSVSNIINSYTNNVKFYRLSGSEFIILARDWDFEEAEIFVNKVLNNLNMDISKSYILPNDIFHLAGTPIDKYGTIDSIMESLFEALKIAITDNQANYKIFEESKIKQQVEQIELEVKKIIQRNEFDIEFSFDSYSFDEKLLIRELKPILKDEKNNILPIGSFIAISEKLDINGEFDKQVILKAFDFAIKNEINYKIAVNLSIKTIAEKDFLDFLNELVNKNSEILNYILFSITSYSAYTYRTQFTEFVEYLNILGFEILLKRYKPRDYPFEDLTGLKIDYIKIDRDLTQNISNDLIKKHRVRNILVYAEVNDIKVMVENVESDKDYAFLSKLDLYAVNR